MLAQIVREFTTGGHNLTFATWENPLWALLEFVRVLELGFAGSIVILGGAVVFSVGAWSWMRTRPVLLWLFFLPVVLCGAVSMAIGHNLWPRLFFFAVGFGILIVVRGAVVTGELAARLLHLPQTSPFP